MSSKSKDDLRRLALRKYQDPTAPAEMKILARGVLLLVDGKLPG